MNWRDEIENSPYKNFVPEYLWNNETFKIYFKLLSSVFDASFENIRKFPDIINPDKTPRKFLELLGAFGNYHYNPLATEEFNRELLMRMFTIWKQRGTEHSIVMAATHGDNPGYVGGDIFIPGYTISKDLASISVPSKNIFIHNKSKFSGIDVFADGNEHMPGLINIDVPYLDDLIRQRVYEVVPAGIRYLFNVSVNFPPNPGIVLDEVGEFNVLSLAHFLRVWPLTFTELNSPIQDAGIDFQYIVEMAVKDNLWDILIHSRGDTGKPLHSGFWETLVGTTIESSLGASLISLSSLTKPFILKETGKEGKDSDYLISGTGEYVDRKDKRYTDSIERDIEEESEILIDRDYRSTFTPSTNANLTKGNTSTVYTGKHSSLARYSGMTNDEISLLVRESPMYPEDVMYTINDVSTLYPSDFRNVFLTGDAEVENNLISSGNFFNLGKSGNSGLKINSITFYGKSWQNGTPSYSSPQEIQNVVPSVRVGSPNLCKSPNFENNAEGWKFKQVTYEPYTETDGEIVTKLTVTKENSNTPTEFLYIFEEGKRGMTYTCSAYVRGKGVFHVEANGHAYSWNNMAGNVALTNMDEYKRVSLSFTIDKSDAVIYLIFYPTIETPLYVKDVQIEQSSELHEYQDYHGTTSTLSNITLRGNKVSQNGNFTDSTGQQWLSDTLTIKSDGTGVLTKYNWYLYKEELTYTKDFDLSDGYALYLSRDIPELDMGAKTCPSTYNSIASTYGVSKGSDKTSYFCTKLPNYLWVYGKETSQKGFYAQPGCIEIAIPSTEDTSNYSSIGFQYILKTPIVTELTKEQVTTFLETLQNDPTREYLYTLNGSTIDIDCTMKV